MVSTRGVKFKFSEGEKVLCYEPDPTKAKVLYESKVLELVVSRDNRGRKVPEYLVHFFGWNSSWDRCVSEDFVLPDNEENRALQKRLAGEAAEKLKGKKRRKLPPILKEGLAKKSCSESDKGDKNESDRSEEETTSESESSEEEEVEEKALKIEIPDVLKKKLEDDCYWITRKGQLVKLPSDPNVVSILESYVKHMATNLICATPVKPNRGKSPSQTRVNEIQARIHLCQEVMDGLRIIFEFTLSELLLYKNERSQYTFISRRYTPLHNNKMEGEIFDRHMEDGLKEEVMDDMPDEQHSSLTTKMGSAMAMSTRLSSQTSDGSFLRQRTSLQQVKSSLGRGRPCSRQCTRRPRNEQQGRTSEEPKTPPLSRRTSRSMDGTHKMLLRDQVMEDGSPPGADDHSSPVRSHGQPPKSPPLGSGRQASTCSMLSSRIVPPPPLSISSISSRNSCASSPHSGPSTPTRIDPIAQNIDMSDMLSDILSWQMIPPHIYEQKPAPASLIYGAQHLLRLFVKLPELLQKMVLPQRKRNTLLKNIDAFLEYLATREEELFPPSAYADHQEVLNCENIDH